MLRLNVKLSEILLLRLRATFHTLPLFHLRTQILRTYAWKNYATVESTLTLIRMVKAYTYYKEIFCVNNLRCPMWFWKMESNVGHTHFHEERDMAFTSDFCDNHSHPASPASLYLTSPRPILDVLKSLVSRPQVPTHASRCPRPIFIHSPLKLLSILTAVAICNISIITFVIPTTATTTTATIYKVLPYVSPDFTWRLRRSRSAASQPKMARSPRQKVDLYQV